MAEETLNKDQLETGVEGGHPSLDLVRECQDCIERGDKEHLLKLSKDLHSADLGALFELLDKQDRVDLAEAIKGELDPAVLTELEGAAFEDVVSVMEPKELAEAVSQLETDDAVYVLEEMDDAEEQRQVLKEVSPEDRLAIEKSLSYPEDSAGRLMQRELVAVPEHWNVSKTLEYLQKTEDLPENFYEIFVVNPKHQPVGTMPLSRVIKTKPTIKVTDIMKLEQTLIPVEEDQEVAANRFRQYNLISAAVVDGAGRLVGVITVDDIVDVIDEEAEEDILALAGVREGDVNVSVSDITKTRSVWLVINLGTAILASYFISLFEGSIEKLVALAILMPIVASMGGNAGSQVMTVAVRALAMNELTTANLLRVLKKEALGGLVNGVLLALLTGALAGFWFASRDLGLVIAAAMVINIFIAALAGILIPVALERYKIDPAVASSILVTTITDVVGFVAFLGLAAWFLF